MSIESDALFKWSDKMAKHLKKAFTIPENEKFTKKLEKVFISGSNDLDSLIKAADMLKFLGYEPVYGIIEDLDALSGDDIKNIIFQLRISDIQECSKFLTIRTDVSNSDQLDCMYRLDLAVANWFSHDVINLLDLHQMLIEKITEGGPKC